MSDTINTNTSDDHVQHGIDDDANNDGTKALGLGAIAGGTVGALAGGPLGAIVGGAIGSIASGAAVDQVDKVDNDNTITGVGEGATRDVGETASEKIADVKDATAHREQI